MASDAATRLRLYAKSAQDEGDQCCEVRTDDVLSVVAQCDALADALTEVLADVDALLGNKHDMRMDSTIAASLRVQARSAHEALAALDEEEA